MIYDLETINVDHMCRSMRMMEFRDTVSRLPYAALVELHAELRGRIGQIDDQRDGDWSDPTWKDRADTARRILESKANMVGRRIESAETLTLVRLAGQHGQLADFRSDAAVRARFLVGLVDRLVDPSTLSPAENTAVGMCRDAAMGKD